MSHVRVNISTLANVKAARKEKRNGRDVVIVPSATLPDDVVMNGIMYPAAEIEASYKSLERTPAPFGHPTVNNKFVSAKDPEGLALGWIGAWNENVRRENGRVFIDKVIDVETANQTANGKAVLEAVNKGTAIHTSTGLYCMMEAVSNKDLPYKNIARAIVFDHDAILLNEVGAATPTQGVGMFVNAKGEQEEVEAINSSMVDRAEEDIDYAMDSLARALERRERAGLMEKLKSVILEGLGFGKQPSANERNEDMADEKQFKDLTDKVDALATTLNQSISKVGETVGAAVANALKPFVDAQEATANAQKAKDEAEKTELVKTVVAANTLTEAVANTLTLEALKELAAKSVPGKAAALNAGKVAPTANTDAFKLPKAS